MYEFKYIKKTTTSALVILPLMVAIIFVVVFINSNSIAIYGQNMTNSSNSNTSQSQNQIQNNFAPITATGTPDKSGKEMRNEKIVRDFYNKVFIAKNASAVVN